MLPYQPNSEALLPALVLPDLPVDPLCPVPRSELDSFFARTILSFFSCLVCDIGVGPGEIFGEAFAETAFLGVGFGLGLGVIFAFGAGVALRFGGVAVAVGFGVAEGNSISLFTVVTPGFSSAASSCSDWPDRVSVGECSGNGDPSGERSPAASNHMMFSGFDEALAAELQRTNPAISARCASAINTTFHQKRFTLFHPEMFYAPAKALGSDA